MNEKRTSVFSNGLIWFGAGVSLAEILTGTYFAPLGFSKAMAGARRNDKKQRHIIPTVVDKMCLYKIK